MKKRLLIAGGSGLIGTALSKEANLRGWETLILSRKPGPGRIVWDPQEGIIDLAHQENFDAIFNLAGSSVTEGRWTDKRKKEIYDSRINSTKTLKKYLEEGSLRTSFYLGMSGIGIYGERGDEVINEETPVVHSDDLFIKTTVDWEAAHHDISTLGIRTIVLRTGIVLSKEGGAVKEILGTPGFGVLSYFGNGQQIWSWIHILDLLRMYYFFLDHPQSKGTYLGSSPQPVTNKVLTKTLNKYLSPKRIVVGVPKLVMSVILGEAHRILFESCNASSEKIEQEGFRFDFPTIDGACKDLLKK